MTTEGAKFHRVDVGVVKESGACDLVHPASTIGQALHFVEACVQRLKPGEWVRITPVLSSGNSHSAVPRMSMSVQIRRETPVTEYPAIVSSVFPQ